jgi:MscS family membrane protein
MEVPDWAVELRTRTNLNLEIVRLAQNLEVSFAFPTRTLHMETRAKETDITAPQVLTNDELKAVINGFGPGGEHARAGGAKLTYGYDAGVTTDKGSAGE